MPASGSYERSDCVQPAHLARMCEIITKVSARIGQLTCGVDVTRSLDYVEVAVDRLIAEEDRLRAGMDSIWRQMEDTAKNRREKEAPCTEI